MRELRTSRSGHEEDAAALADENSSLHIQVAKLKTEAQRAEVAQEKVLRKERALVAVQEKLADAEKDLEELRAAARKSARNAAKASKLHAEAVATAEHAEQLRQENQDLRRQLLSWEEEAEQRLAAGGLTQNLRQRLEHELSVAQARLRGVETERDKACDQLKRVEKQLHKYKKLDVGEQTREEGAISGDEKLPEQRAQAFERHKRSIQAELEDLRSRIDNDIHD